MFLTTHLMEEAERLCDRVAIIDHGRIVDIGAPAELVPRHCPTRTVVVTTGDPSAVARFGRYRARRVGHPRRRGRHHSRCGDDFVTELIHCLADHRIPVDDFRTEPPTLEDVFLKLTGHSVRD